MPAPLLARVEPLWSVIMPRYGDALIERRELRGFDTASDLAKKSKEVAEQLNDPQLSAFSQQTLSRLESDKSGEYIANARPRIQRMLSYLLGWSAEEFEAAVGISIPAVSYLGSSTPESSSEPAFDPRTLFHPPAQRTRIKRELWPNLSEMIEEKQGKYPELKQIRWQQHLNQTRFSGGREPDAEGWFEMFQTMRRNHVEPEEWPEE